MQNHVDGIHENAFIFPGEKWHARRKLLTPTFHFKILQDFLAVFTEETKKLVDKIEANLDDSGIDITHYIDHLTLQSVGGKFLRN